MRELTPAGRLLVVNQLGINLGFYMVLPFLAAYLRHDLGFATALVGLILGLRALSQQGLYLVGGTAADRLGPRPMIIAGCALRAVGFGLFAAATSVPAIVAGTVLTGLAGAIFNPAVRAYLIHEHPGRRAEAFAIFNTVSNAGTLLGPVVGAALLGVNFRVVSLAACVVFAALTAAQVLALPPRAIEPLGQTVLASWGEVLRGFALMGASYLPLVVAAPLTPAAAGALDLDRALLAAGPVLAVTVLFSLGVAVASPFMVDLLPVVGSLRLVGTYYGYFYPVSAIIATGVSALVGALLDLAAPSARVIPFATLAALGVLGGAAIAAMERRRLLDPRQESAV